MLLGNLCLDMCEYERRLPWLAEAGAARELRARACGLSLDEDWLSILTNQVLEGPCDVLVMLLPGSAFNNRYNRQ